MSRKPVQRIAFVQLSPEGKPYAMRCDRKDLEVGDDVEVEMYAGTKRAYIDDGVITSVSYQRWKCSCHVINHIEEVSYSIDTTDGFALQRKVDLSKRIKRTVKEWQQEKAPYFESLPESTRSDMRDIYEAVAPEPESGEDAYLGDGIWVKADGSLDDQGRYSHITNG